MAPTLLALVAAPAGAAPDPSFVFGAAGDFGYSSNALASMSAAGAAGLNFFMTLGDTAYTEANESTWCAAFKAQVPNLLVQSGNHDTGESAGVNLTALIASCPYTLSETLNGRYAREWYFDYPGAAPLARFIMTGCGNDFASDGDGMWDCMSGDTHYNFVAGAIDAARTAGIPWVIVGMHKNCISAGDKTCEIGTDFFDLLLNKRVDIVLQGHDHLYERSKQLTCATPNLYRPACVANDGSTGIYVKGQGPVINVIGTGGRPNYPFNSSDAEAPYFAEGWSGTFGFSKFRVNATSIRVSFVRSAGNADGDAFMIEAPQAPDTVAPPLTLSAPADQSTVTSPSVHIVGTTEAGATVTANGVSGAVAPNGSFSFFLTLVPGLNNINVTARDAAGNSNSSFVRVTFDDPVPGLLAQLANATAQVDELTANLSLARADLLLAQADLAALRASGNATQQQLAQAQAALDASLAKVSSLQLNLTAALGSLSQALALAAQALAQADSTTANLTAAQRQIVELRAAAANASASANRTQADLNATQTQLAIAQSQLVGAQADAEAAKASPDAAAWAAWAGVALGLAAVAVAGMGLRAGRRRRPE